MPSLGVHFSPVRYSRLMKLLDVMYGTIQNGTQPVSANFQDELAPWNPPDLATEAQILVWKVSAANVRLFIYKPFSAS